MRTTTLGAAALPLGLLPLLSSVAALPLSDRSLASAALDKRLSASVTSCLNEYSFEKSYPSSADYANLSRAENENLSYSPSVIALPTSEEDAADVVRCVAQDEAGAAKLAVRSGGHSYEAYGLGGQNGSVVLDVRHFNNISIDSENKAATVGAGVRLGDLAKVLAENGFALPMGTCSYVGVGGHGLGGGYGLASRPWGYLMDHITSMRFVHPNGTLLTVSPDSESDLWWALRGGGQNNYGAVLSFDYALEDAPTSTVDFSYGYKSNSDCVEVLLALQQTVNTTSADASLPKELTAELLWITEAAANGGAACKLTGQHVNATLDSHAAAFQKLRDITQANGGVDYAQEFTSVTHYDSWTEALLDPNIMATFDTANPEANTDPYYAKSIVQPTASPYTREVATALMAQLNEYANTDGTGNSISFAGFGPLSQTNAPAKNASAFVHRDTLFLSQLYSYGTTTPAVQRNLQTLVDTARTTSQAPDLAAQGWGGYINYVDRLQSNWSTAYYGDAVERMKRIKTQVDPNNVFDYPQGIAHA